MNFGLILICLGVLFLLNNLGYIEGGLGRLVLPALIIILGGSIILKGLSGQKQNSDQPDR